MLNYNLPRELIAQRPVEPRDACRLLVLTRTTGVISHHSFHDLPRFLQPGDCLILNDTKVLPARLYGKRAQTGGRVELLLLSPHPDPLPKGQRGSVVFRCLGKPGKGLPPGARIHFNHGTIEGEVLLAQGQERIVRFSGQSQDLFLLGEIPLPPYIDRPVVAEDADWYQTIYARRPGAVAAPTAGLHFTQELLGRIQGQGVQVAFVTLHVGWGTFKPVKEEELESGRLHEERFHLPAETAQVIHETKAKSGRVVAVGTTVVRVLETYALRQTQGERTRRTQDERVMEGMTDLFIRPPYEFEVVDALITNFHLPGTSLLLLVAAFAGEEKIMSAYQEAIRQRYRFYSYGDAMLIL